MALLGTFLTTFGIFNVDVTIALATISVFILYWYTSGPKNIPPGPKGLPIVGYLPFLGTKPHETFQHLSKKYGSLFSLYLGNRLVVVLNDYDTIKEAFVKQGNVFAGRPNMDVNLAERDIYGVPFATGEIWKTHRRFALNVLRDLGVGKLSIESRIMDEIQHFLGEIKKCDGKPSDFSHMLTASISNNICILIFGKRFEYDDPWFKGCTQAIAEFAMAASATSVLLFMPWMRILPGIAKFMNQESLTQTIKGYKEKLFFQIRKLEKIYVEGERDNYVNAFLGEQKVRAKKVKNDHMFSEKAMEENCRSLMMAMTETTSNTLMWSILCMIQNPEVQKKVQKEIDEVIGTERVPSWNDRLQTPYTEATICELQRFETLIPTNVPHRTTDDCELLGYHIPKDTMVMSNLWAVHNDPKLWDEPEVFRPERFLTPSGELEKKEYLIPFSLGKRECLGISLAKMELYLYFTSMLQKFTFKSSDGKAPSMEPRVGITVAPKFFNVRAELRKN